MKYYKRGFLNKETGMAAFEADVDFEEGREYHWVGADFTISDCNRQICLEFSIDNEQDVTDKISKLQNLINELSDFKNKLMEASLMMLEELSKKDEEKNAKL